MSANRLKLNADKTQFIWVGIRQNMVNCQSVNLNWDDFQPTQSYLRSCLRQRDKFCQARLTFVMKMRPPSWNCFHHLQQLRSARRALATNAVNTLTARLIVHKRKCEEITATIRDQLHWLPVRQRIEFKLGTIVYRCLHNTSPHNRRTQQHFMTSFKIKKVIFDWVEINYPLMIGKLFVKKKILWDFCTIYKIICLSFSQCRLWMFFWMYLCNDAKLSRCQAVKMMPSCQDDHQSLTENVTSWFPQALSAQQLLTYSVASQECCINMWDFEMLITENDLQRVWESGLILPEIKRFTICKQRWIPIGKTHCRSRSCEFKWHPHQASRALPHRTET